MLYSALHYEVKSLIQKNGGEDGIRTHESALKHSNGLANPQEDATPMPGKLRKHAINGISSARIGRYTREMLGLAQARESAHNKVKTIEQLLSRFTVTEDGCHEWTGSTNGKGYGVLLLGGGSKDRKLLLLAHRLQWMHHHGPIDRGTVIMHKCDNRRCINIDHLGAGSQLDNMHDMIAKGRHNYRGLRHSAESAQVSAQDNLARKAKIRAAFAPPLS